MRLPCLAGKLFRLIGLWEEMKLIYKEGSPAGVKALMEMMGTVKNQVRLPNVPVSAGTYGLIEAEWKKIR